jgi:hypothetical protein
MTPDDGDGGLGRQVAELSKRVDSVQEAVERTGEATAGLREDVARLRTEMNGHLPRIDRNVERIFEKLDEGQELMHACHERTEVQANEIGTIFRLLAGKSDRAANDEAHARLWLFLRISLAAVGMGVLGSLVLKALAV